ncbi:hypothetical protein AAGW05_01110 [Arthrobacter sp. LAPM80]|uniref:hypothetical protein n=1 Tax=Arthrobacter sp. LAPM80 TaxID=3141788 RepID=UPI00398BAC6D
MFNVPSARDVRHQDPSGRRRDNASSPSPTGTARRTAASSGAPHRLTPATLPDHLATEHAMTATLTKAEQAQLEALLKRLGDAADHDRLSP